MGDGRIVLAIDVPRWCRSSPVAHTAADSKTRRYCVPMIPWIILAVIAIPLLEDAGTIARTEQEFADAEAYQEQWREEEKKHQRDTML